MSDERTLVDRIVVEPLDDERWTSIERGVIGALRTASIERALADRRPARARWAWPVLGAAVAAAAAVGMLVARRGPAAIDRPGPSAPVAIATDASGTRIDLGRAVLTVAPDTTFALTRPEGGVDISLDHGAIELAVEHRDDLPPVVVHAGDVDVIDVGTVFTVERRRDGAVAVSVREGEVRIERAGTATRVVAGQRWAGGELIAIAAPGATGGAAARPRAHPDAVPIPIGGPDDLLTRRHVSAAPHGGAAAPRGSTGEPRQGHGGAAVAPPAPADPIADLRAAIAAQPVRAAGDVGTTDPTAALERYRRLATDDKGAAASGGLYGMARIQSLALGQSGDALRTLGAYVKRFPDGAELEAVLWLRLRILCRGGIDDACRAAAHTYLGRFPDGDRARLVERITVARQ